MIELGIKFFADVSTGVPLRAHLFVSCSFLQGLVILFVSAMPDPGGSRATETFIASVDTSCRSLLLESLKP